MFLLRITLAIVPVDKLAEERDIKALMAFKEGTHSWSNRTGEDLAKRLCTVKSSFSLFVPTHLAGPKLGGLYGLAENTGATRLHSIPPSCMFLRPRAYGFTSLRIKKLYFDNNVFELLCSMGETFVFVDKHKVTVRVKHLMLPISSQKLNRQGFDESGAETDVQLAFESMVNFQRAKTLVDGGASKIVCRSVWASLTVSFHLDGHAGKARSVARHRGEG